MKTIKSSITGLALLVIMFACNTSKEAQLSKLKEKQTALNEKILKLQGELSSNSTDTLDPGKFKFVAIKDVATDTFDHYIRVQGKLDGDQNAAVFAESPGTIIAKYADVGQKVVKGQILAQIDDEQFRTQMEGLESQYKLASDLFDKQKRLWDQKIGSEVQLMQAKTNKEALEKQISSTKQQLDKFKIKSPITGTIEECNIKIGGVVSPDPRLAAYRVVAFKNLKVSAEVSEAYSSKVRVGDKLLVQFPDINKTVEARVDFVSKYINPINRTFIVESKILDGISDLKANMIAIIQINDYHKESAIQLPMNVIQTDLTGSYVYIVRQKDNFNAAHKQPVVLGTSYNGVAEVIGGLTVGDKVVSAGYQDLVEGEYIRF